MVSCSVSASANLCSELREGVLSACQGRAMELFPPHLLSLSGLSITELPMRFTQMVRLAFRCRDLHLIYSRSSYQKTFDVEEGRHDLLIRGARTKLLQAGASVNPSLKQTGPLATSPPAFVCLTISHTTPQVWPHRASVEFRQH